MPERSTVTQTLQVGPEVAYGSHVAATRKLQAATFDFSGEGNVDAFRPSSNKYATVAAQGKEWASGRVGGLATYSELGYMLAMNVCAPAVAQIGATTAYQWEYTPLPETEDTIKSFTVEQGSALRSHAFFGVVLPDFGYNLTRDRFELTGRALAKSIDDNHALTPALSPLELVPILPKQCSVYADAAPGAIGGTKLTRCLRVEWANNNRFGPHWVIDAAQDSFVATVELEPAATLRLVMQANADGMAYLTQFRAGTKVYLQIKATGADAGGGNLYTFQHNICGVISEPWRFQNEEGVWCVGWTFRACDDDTLGYPYYIKLINKLTALA